MTRYASRFGRVARTLSRVELMRSSMDEAFPLSDRDLLDRNAGRRFLDFYGDEGLSTAFERYGLFDALKRRGWGEPRITTNAMDDRHTLLLDATKGEAWERIVELVVRRDRLVVDDIDDAFDVLTVDWLLLQNPGQPFSERRPRLPGQDHPGLGLGERVMEMLYITARRLELDALVTTAEYFHNAALYARELTYVDPRCEGQLEALETLLFDQEELTLAQASWAMHWGYVLDVDDSVVRWRGEAMARAENKTLRRWLQSKDHAVASSKRRRGLRYRLHRAAFDDQWDRERAELTSAYSR